jgi:hypothetical protein
MGRWAEDNSAKLEHKIEHQPKITQKLQKKVHKVCKRTAKKKTAWWGQIRIVKKLHEMMSTEVNWMTWVNYITGASEVCERSITDLRIFKSGT